MRRAGNTALKIGIAVWAARTAWNAVTNNEEQHADNKADRNIQRAVQISNQKISAEKVLQLQEKEKARVMQLEAPFTKFKSDITNAAKEMITKNRNKGN